MLVRLVVFSLRLPEARSLKDKRMVVRSLKDRMRSRFNVSVAESDFQDQRNRAEISVAFLAPSAGQADALQEHLDRLIDEDGRAHIVHVHRESL